MKNKDNLNTSENKEIKVTKKRGRKETIAIILIAILCAGGFIAWDVVHNRTQATDSVTVESLLENASQQLHDMSAIRVDIKEDCYIEVTKGTIMTPYVCGEDITSDITSDPYLLHIDGYTVHQANSSRNRNLYEKYLEISAGTTTAYTNRDDLIWTKDTYESQNTIFDSFDFYDMALEHADDFEIVGTFNVDNAKCYDIQGELFYEDMLPYIDDLTVFEDGKAFWNSIQRNGFYAWVHIYVDIDTHQVRQLYIDFKDIAQAFADKDGVADGTSTIVSTFYMKVKYSRYNGFKDITINQSIKEQAIDAEEFLRRLANGELSYEDAIYYEALFGYTLKDFEYYAKQLGLTQEQYEYLKSIFNFDAYGKPQFPSFTEAQFETFKQAFAAGYDYNYFYETFGWTEAEYNYYKAFFTTFTDYGAYAIFQTMTEQEFVYYYNLIQLSGNTEYSYQKLMNFITSVYTYNPVLLTQVDFEYIQSLFTTDQGYQYYKDLMGWTQGEYNFYKTLFTFIQANANVYTNSNVYQNSYQYYCALITAINNYSQYTSTFKFTVSEYNYYSTIFNYVSTYSDYQMYISDYESYINYVSGNNNGGSYNGNSSTQYNGNGNTSYNTFASTSSATYNYYRRLYEQIGGTNSQYKTFKEFIQYITTHGANPVVNNQIVSVYVPDYDGKLGEDRIGSGGISSNGQLSDKWYSFSMKYNDYIISLPCSYSELVGVIGYQLRDADASKILSAGDTINKNLFKDGKSIAVVLKNKTNSEKSLADCTVCSITINKDISDSAKFEFPDGVKIGDSYSEVESKYGEASNEAKTSNTTTYTYNSSVRNENMKIAVKDGKVIKITYTYY